MTQATKMTAEETMLARHSVRKYEKGAEIPEQELNEILTLAASAPSSWNLQHWRFLVFQDKAKREKLLEIAYNQQQVADASVVVVVLGDLEADKEAHNVYDPAVAAGKMPEQAAQTLIGNIENAYANIPTIGRDEAIRNASFAAMQLMLAAKAKGYDTVPMGGYDADALVKEYNIPSRYIPVVMIPIGVAATPAHATDRFPLEKLMVKEGF
ncbi:MAG TPA: nitroreductase family protein [Bacilli bacterium]|nr:nitroreductase family protein [Bacilli bacterium]